VSLGGGSTVARGGGWVAAGAGAAFGRAGRWGGSFAASGAVDVRASPCAGISGSLTRRTIWRIRLGRRGATGSARGVAAGAGLGATSSGSSPGAGLVLPVGPAFAVGGRWLLAAGCWPRSSGVVAPTSAPGMADGAEGAGRGTGGACDEPELVARRLVAGRGDWLRDRGTCDELELVAPRLVAVAVGGRGACTGLELAAPRCAGSADSCLATGGPVGGAALGATGSGSSPAIGAGAAGAIAGRGSTRAEARGPAGRSVAVAADVAAAGPGPRASACFHRWLSVCRDRWQGARTAGFSPRRSPTRHLRRR